MVFSLSALWWRRIRGLWKLDDGRDWLRGKESLVLMGGAVLSKSLIQFSVERLGCIFPLSDLRPNYGGDNEDNGDCLQKVPCKHCYTQFPQPWTIKKAEHWRIDAFELCCWRRLLRIPWTARRSNQSILKEISPEFSLEGLMLKLKFRFFGHLMWRADLFEKTLMLRKIEGGRRSGR